MKKFILLALIVFCCALSGCGFRPRSSAEVPEALKVLYLDTPNPVSPFSVQLARTLNAVHIRLVNEPKDAPFILRILESGWQYDIPNMIYSGNAISYSYTFRVRYTLQKRSGEFLFQPKTLTVSRSLIQNANQIYTPDATMLMKREITRTMVILLYNNLVSIKTRNLLNHIHAIH